MLTLMDSGSSHCFISGNFLAKLGIKPQSAPPAQVKVVNGNMLLSTQIVKNITSWIQGHTFQTDMRVLDLEVYDAIFGNDWFRHRSPIESPMFSFGN